VSSSDLHFDADAHTYTLNGRRLPSVTQVIGAVIERRFNPGDWYLQRGRALHHAIHLMVKGTLDWESVDDRIFGRLKALEKFLKQTGYKIIVSEVPLAHSALMYAGTLDALLEGQGGHVVLVDFKSSLEAQVELQLGAYMELLRDNNPTMFGRATRALALQLGEYDYKCHWIDYTTRATAHFRNVLSVYNWMRLHKCLPTPQKEEIVA
jgi:hypothetical protein